MAHRIPNSRLRIIAKDSRVLDGMDSHVAQRHREIGGALCSDMGGGDHLSEAQKQLVRCAAGLVVLRETLDTKAANGEAIDSREYCAVCDTLRRVLTTIGLQGLVGDMTDSQADQIKRVLQYIEEAES
jgi:hypothetical protein